MVGSRNSASSQREFEPVIDALASHKAHNVIVLDLRGLSDATDYFVIATGTSDTHVRALAERAIDSMKDAGRRPHHIEGLASGRWVLIDFVDVVVHVFHPTLREFYQLERLWADAPAVSTGSSR